MTLVETEPPQQPPAAMQPSPQIVAATPPPAAGRSRAVLPRTNRVRRDGKFFRLGDEKFYVKGVTYGPFKPATPDGEPLPSRERVAADFDLIRDLGANCLRIYHTPPVWFLELAQDKGLKIFLDVAWPKNLVFTESEEIREQACAAVRDAAKRAGNHPAVFAISVVNEVPADLVRFVGHGAVADFIDELVAVAKREAPDCLVTFANFPTTEYLQPREVDFVCFNVYLHDETAFRNYAVRLQHIAGEKPLMLGEYGIDTFQEYSEERQAEILTTHVKAVFEEGLAGTFIFAFTDDWYTHGWQIEDWAFGVVRKDRSPKPAFAALRKMFARVPQTTDVPLPRVSVIICSYNGASTVESCLRSMGKINYPDFEVVFVDDGSTDRTQEIVAQFPWVRNIVQENKGLSVARNVGMEAATGEVIVYTDSDCEADEDWLYYMALNLVRGGHVGVGGPNFIPDEGSWVADCVGLSPGGPTHVMLDDRTAEHVPGCNMGFFRHAAMGINGFDGQFRKAGDDVDFIWRLQHAGGTIGFAPAGQVWHYRRNTVKAYLKQQRGYGEAEALLKYKHPDHFNTLGASHWRGKIYGGESVGVHVGRDVVYHGVFGTGLFQTMYRRRASLTAAMLMSVEWQLLALFVGLLGLAFPVLFWVAGGMLGVPILLACVAAAQAPAPEHPSPWSRPLIAYLHWRQPITRGLARYTERLKAKTLRPELRAYRRKGPLPFDPDDRSLLRYWHHAMDRDALIPALVAEAKSAGLRIRPDSGWQPWDLELYGSRYVKVRVTSVTEKHADGKMTKLRVEMTPSTFCLVLIGAALILAGLLLANLWPFSRPAVLIPVAWWALYLVNKYRLTLPVLGLIDAAAEKAGFWPVATKKESSTNGHE